MKKVDVVGNCYAGSESLGLFCTQQVFGKDLTRIEGRLTGTDGDLCNFTLVVQPANKYHEEKTALAMRFPTGVKVTTLEDQRVILISPTSPSSESN